MEKKLVAQLRRLALLFTVLSAWTWTNLSSSVSAQDSGEVGRTDQGVTVNHSIQQLNEAAAALYRHVLDKDIEQVQEGISRISQRLEHISFDGQATVEGIHALTETVVEVKEAAARVRNDEVSLQQASAKLRLAADSLANPAKPLWLQYFKIMQNDLQALTLAAEQRVRSDELAGLFNALEEHYETIRPAALIRREPSQIEQLDAWLSHIKGLVTSKQTDWGQLRSMFEHGSEQVNLLFGREKDESAFVAYVDGPDRRTAGLLITSVIVIALGYAGYRKYRAQQDGIVPFQR